MAQSWVRLWAGMTTDPKWQTIARKSGEPRCLVIALFAHMMLAAIDEGGDVSGLNAEDAASAMDCDESQVVAILDAMQGRVIADGKLTGWERRQPAREDAVLPGSKPGAQRTREHRERKKSASNACNADVTRCNAPDTDTDTDTDTETTTAVGKLEREKSAARGTRLSADWMPTSENVAYCREKRPDLDPEIVADNFRDYWASMTGQGATKANWTLTWNRWVRNERAVIRAGPKRPEKFDPVAYVNRNRTPNLETATVIDITAERLA
jgi:hypothetical protein